MMVELKMPFGKVTKSLCQTGASVNEPWKPNILEGASILKEPGASSAWGKKYCGQMRLTLAKMAGRTHSPRSVFQYRLTISLTLLVVSHPYM
jgi:hypothetical protein